MATVKLTPLERSQWLQLISWLKKDCPVGKPVVVRTRKITDNAYAYLHKGKYHIEINPKASFDYRVDLLIHEWAHLKMGLKEIPKCEQEQHSPAWGAMFGVVYQSYIRWREHAEKKNAE